MLELHIRSPNFVEMIDDNKDHLSNLKNLQLLAVEMINDEYQMESLLLFFKTLSIKNISVNTDSKMYVDTTEIKYFPTDSDIDQSQ